MSKDNKFYVEMPDKVAQLEDRIRYMQAEYDILFAMFCNLIEGRHNGEVTFKRSEITDLPVGSYIIDMDDDRIYDSTRIKVRRRLWHEHERQS